MNRRFFHVSLIGLLTLMAFSFLQCNQNSYANLVKSERKVVADYLKREHINVIYDLPENGVWGEKDYLDMSLYGYENLYVHIVSLGDTTTEEVERGDKVVLRYRRYSLGLYPDTVSYWTTADTGFPIEFAYLTDQTTACLGWHYAIGVMKYTDAEAKIINPSKYGFEDETSSVTPYGYDLKIKIRK